MKIGLVGNMNNLSFAIARYLKEFGYDCEVLVFNNDHDWFYPVTDTFSDNYKETTRHITWGDPSEIFKVTARQIREDIKTFDFIIGCGMAPAAFEKIGRKLDLFIPYGYDLYSLPFLKLVHPLRMPAYFTVAYLQRRGIRRTPLMIFDKTNEGFEAVIRKINYPGKRIISTIPLLYHKEYTEENILRNQYQHPNIAELQKLRAENDVIFLQHIRQVWKHTKNKWSIKGNDMLLVAYKQFLERNPGIKSRLILFEYGVDVNETKKLVAELGIEKNVYWLAKMPRKYVMITLQFADLVIGELTNSWLTYGALSEALCAGKPFMHKRIDDEFISDYPQLYPMIYADSVETVLKGLEGAVNDKEKYREIGKQGQAWFLEYIINRPLQNILQIIREHSVVQDPV